MRQLGVSDAASTTFTPLMYASKGSVLTSELEKNALDAEALPADGAGASLPTVELLASAFASCAALRTEHCRAFPTANQSLLLPPSFTAPRVVPYFCNVSIPPLNGTGRGLQPQESATKNIPTDKNWSPFVARGRLRAVYSLGKTTSVCDLGPAALLGSALHCLECALVSEHIQADLLDAFKLDSHRHIADPRLHESASVISSIMRNESDQGEKVHMNGLQLLPASFVLPDSREGYVGVCHCIFMGSYTNYFFMLSGEPPYRVVSVSGAIPLTRTQLDPKYWGTKAIQFEAFVSGFDGNGTHVILSYGSGDIEARLAVLPVSQVAKLFKKGIYPYDNPLRP